MKNRRCTINGCWNLSRSRTSLYCEKHYYRLYRNGTLELRRPPKRTRHSNGYILVYAPDHPLTKRHGGQREYEHRIVFYDYHGDGAFNCHWCDSILTWDNMHVDHLNDLRDDNRIENLVASCPTCNQKRGHPKVRTTMRKKFGKPLEWRGESRTFGEWATMIGIARASLAWRLNHGWPLHLALTKPSGNTGPKKTIKETA